MKLFKQAVVVALVALCLEIGVFNFSAMKSRFSSNSLKNQSYTLADCTQINWVQAGGELISQPDPQLILKKLYGHIEQIELRLDVIGNLPYIEFFYTNNVTTAFSGEAMLRVEGVGPTGGLIPFNQDVTALRIDLGDAAGLRVKDLQLIVNPTAVEISMARIITVFLLFFVGKFLFSLQRTPEYNLYEDTDASPKVEDTP